MSWPCFWWAKDRGHGQRLWGFWPSSDFTRNLPGNGACHCKFPVWMDHDPELRFSIPMFSARMCFPLLNWSWKVTWNCPNLSKFPVDLAIFKTDRKENQPKVGKSSFCSGGHVFRLTELQPPVPAIQKHKLRHQLTRLDSHFGKAPFNPIRSYPLKIQHPQQKTVFSWDFHVWPWNQGFHLGFPHTRVTIWVVFWCRDGSNRPTKYLTNDPQLSRVSNQLCFF